MFKINFLYFIYNSSEAAENDKNIRNKLRKQNYRYYNKIVLTFYFIRMYFCKRKILLFGLILSIKLIFGNYTSC